ncbi:dihydrolipoyl dehydrogenase [Candidatus Bathyarchaeota archaeon]|nr:dihydrolipoyl dehydrogenase [Candidatus Bathyarchaeota archaeon]
MFKERVDVAVIGGGPGGYVAAIRAAQLGGKVALIECGKLGGTCVNKGCIPTKALLETIKIYDLLKRSREFDIETGKLKLNFKEAVNKAKSISDKISEKISILMEKKGVKVVSGFGRFKKLGVIEVSGRENGEVEYEKVIVASGSSPVKPPILGVESKGVLTSDEALKLDEKPESLVVIGGGAVGVEFATIFNGLDAETCLIEMMPHILPGEDEEITDYLNQLLQENGVKTRTNAKALKIEEALNNKIVHVLTPKGIEEFKGNIILLASGRKPLTEGFGLENINVKIEGGKILVNDKMETNVPGVYAVGDVTGRFMLAHTAMQEGIIAAENAMGLNSKMDYRIVPRCVYSWPEAAFIGLTENQAKKEFESVNTTLFPFSANGRAETLKEARGVVKIVFEEETGEVLGAQIVGLNASELIHEVALAIKIEATIDDLAYMIYAHPTLSEAIKEAALKAKNKSIHL